MPAYLLYRTSEHGTLRAISSAGPFCSEAFPSLALVAVTQASRQPLVDDLPALGARSRPHVDDPVSGIDDVDVVLYDDNAPASIDKPVEDLQEFFDLGKMKPGGRLIQDVQGALDTLPRQLSGEFDALSLPGGKGW